jgi:hypothetical protein
VVTDARGCKRLQESQIFSANTPILDVAQRSR